MEMVDHCMALGNGGIDDMWQYEKKLQFPVKIKNPNPMLAKVIMSQLGGPHSKKRES